MNRILSDNPQGPKNPIQNASFFERHTYWWLIDIFQLGMKRPIEQSDIYETLPDFQSKIVTEPFERQWNEQKKQLKPSLLDVIVKIYAKQFITIGVICKLLEFLVRLIQPLCLGELITFFATDNMQQNDHKMKEDNHIYFYGIAIILLSLFYVSIYHPYVLYGQQLGTRLRLACCSLIYKKAFRLTKSIGVSNLNGKIINLLATDVTRFDLAFSYLHDLWKAPLELIFFSYFIYREIGFYGWIGIGIILLMIPIQIRMAKLSAKYRIETAQKTDTRVKIMNEIIQGIQVIKMYTWEKPFAKIVDTIRKNEIKSIKGALFIRGIILSFGIISRVSLFFSLASYVYFGNVFTARKVFIVTSYYNYLANSALHMWAMGIITTVEIKVTIKRIQDFLLLPETKAELLNVSDKDVGLQKLIADSKVKHKMHENGTQNVDDDNVISKEESANEDKNKVNKIQQHIIINENGTENHIIFQDVCAYWISDNKLSINGINNVCLEIYKNTLCTIIGSVGAGKTTLLQVILGELELDNGNLLINGKISYAAQEPWLFEGTIKQNILFIENYDEERYNKIVSICALERDFEILPYGDETIVGEKGVILSGGQRARVNLARAIYKKADIYLLDDPLSAVDAHVGKHLFDKCITEFLKDKICILVTHQLQYLENVKHVVLMNSGSILAQGTFGDLKNSQNYSLLGLVMNENSKIEDVDNLTIEPKSKSITPSKPKNIQEKNKEIASSGTVDNKVYLAYFKSIDSLFILFMVIAFLIIAQFGTICIDVFVTKWVNWEGSVKDKQIVVIHENNNTTPYYIISSSSTVEQREEYILIYSIAIVIVLYLVFQRSFATLYACLRVSRRLHDKIFRSITRSPMYFFNTNPSGRILNRFSKDIGSMDSMLPALLLECSMFILTILSVTLIVALVNYWLLLPTILLYTLFYGFRRIYVESARCIKRIEAITRTPIFAHTNSTLQGLTTIRAFKAQEILSNEFDVHQDVNTSSHYLFISITRAFCLWLDIVCVFYTACIILFFLVFRNEILGGNVGLVITQLFTIIGISQYGMRQTAELENQMTSVERVVEYTELKPEPAIETDPKNCPPPEWPIGSITFNDLSMRYSESSDLVLNKLTFHIEAKEKIGIVGRTGAGKSSIIQAIFRLAHNEGSLKIDNVDISTIGLHDLRNKISIIPQDPVLFSGTMRNNLDPFNERTDDEIWKALEQVELKEAIRLLADGLDCKISNSGSNFSMGQRQLVCLARAILRNNKILILDEATANVDDETDQLIQTTIRDTFGNCTVITIAHRLQTVMDNDKILVMDAGNAVEYDHPYQLLQRSDGYLRKLVDNTGKLTAKKLSDIAESKYLENTKLYEREN